MTTPERSPIAEPGGFPEHDLLVGDILSATIAFGDPPTAVPADTDASNLGTPAFDVHVPAGRRSLNRYGDVDEAFVYVGAWGADRDDATELQRMVRRALAGYRDGGLWRGVQIHRIREVTGPSSIPRAQDAPDRLVESGWSVLLRKHRGDLVRS